MSIVKNGKFCLSSLSLRSMEIQYKTIVGGTYLTKVFIFDENLLRQSPTDRCSKGRTRRNTHVGLLNGFIVVVDYYSIPFLSDGVLWFVTTQLKKNQ